MSFPAAPRHHHGGVVVAFCAGVATTALFFCIVNATNHNRRRNDNDDEEEEEVVVEEEREVAGQPGEFSGLQRDAAVKNNKGSRRTVPPPPPVLVTRAGSLLNLFPSKNNKHRWPWENGRAKSSGGSRSSSTESSETSSSSTTFNSASTTTTTNTTTTTFSSADGAATATTTTVGNSEHHVVEPLSHDGGGGDNKNTNKATTTTNTTGGTAAASPSAKRNSATAQSKQGNLCIGSIFGLDVGGTLAKLVYFEAELDQISTTATTTTPTSSSYAAAAAMTATPSSSTVATEGGDGGSDTGGGAIVDTETPRFLHIQKRASMTKVPSRKDWKPLPVAQEHFYQHLHHPHTHSVPSNLDTLGGGIGGGAGDDHHHDHINQHMVQKAAEDEDNNNNHLSRRKSTNSPAAASSWSSSSFPASLSSRKLLPTRSSSFHELEPPPPLADHNNNNATRATKSDGHNNNAEAHRQYRRREALTRFYAVAKTLAAAHDFVSNRFYSGELGGTFHFIQFETKHMVDAMDLIRHYNLHMNIQEMGGTGGGAHKYAELLRDELAIEMKKQDELDSLVAGMQFVLNTVVGECYTYRPNPIPPTTTTGDNESHDEHAKKVNRCTSNVESWSQRVVQRHEEAESSSSAAATGNNNKLYPYLVVMVGTGVSVLRVDGPRQYERVSGSTIGGGTFFGLIRLLTDADKFDDGKSFVLVCIARFFSDPAFTPCPRTCICFRNETRRTRRPVQD
jgi:pantothenate kinase